MTPERIKQIRTALGITQEDLATILGVTKTTVGRYEVGMAKPVGDAEKKLAQLDSAIVDPMQKDLITEMLLGAGGHAALASSLALGAAMMPLATIVASGIGLAAILAGPAGKTLFDALKKFHAEKEDKGQP